MKYYAGIGSRETPQSIRSMIHEFVIELNRQNYCLRSGGADGADTFFEEVAIIKEIFLPWKGFNKRPATRTPSKNATYIQSPTDKAVELAEEIIDQYANRDHGPRMLLARNMHQILGEDLATPVEFVICWTPDGKVAGGTAHAIRLARMHRIAIFNLAKSKDVHALRELLYQQRLF